MKLLRARLEELGREHSLHFDAIDGIRDEFDHSIELIERWPADIPGKQNFNCVVFALELRDDQLHNSIAESWDIVRGTPSRGGDNSIHADTEFLEFCIAKGRMLPILDRERGPGDLLVYRNNGECGHIGKVVEGGRICSKWGTDDLLEHEPLEVRDRYGDDLQYVGSLTREQSRGLFIEYAWSVMHHDPLIKKHFEQKISEHL